MKPMREIAQAERVVAELQRKRAAAVQRATELADERAAVSYAAKVQYDVEARQRLHDINSDLALYDSELRNIDAALAEAIRRVGQEKAA
jgi:hypothetical protein